MLSSERTTPHGLNALITTRVAPRELNLCEPGRQRVLTLDEGLKSPYAENILREMDEDGKLGLKARKEEMNYSKVPVKRHAATRARWKPYLLSFLPTATPHWKNCLTCPYPKM